MINIFFSKRRKGMVRLGIPTFLQWNITTAPVVFIATGYMGILSLAAARQVLVDADLYLDLHRVLILGVSDVLPEGTSQRNQRIKGEKKVI